MTVVFEDVDGSSVALEYSGAGSPTLIFVHGLACDRRTWDLQVSALAAQFRCVSIDLPGHGESDLPGVRGEEALARAVASMASRHGGGHVVLIGHSLGCRVILEAYRSSSTDIDGLVLVDGGRSAGASAESVIRLLEEKIDVLGVHKVLAAAFEGMFLPGTDRRLVTDIIARSQRIDPAWASQLLLSTARWQANTAIQMLAGVKVPLLVMQSTYLDEHFRQCSLEPGMTTSFEQAVMRGGHDAQIRTITGAGHFVQIEAAKTVNRYIREFAMRLSPRGLP